MREIGVIAAAFYFRRWWPLRIVAFVTALATPLDGSYWSTVVMHMVAGPLAWVMARFLWHRVSNPVVLGLGLGLGLGLATVYGIVRHHEGAITVTSRLGEGTSFHITWPAYRAKAGDQGQVA